MTKVFNDDNYDSDSSFTDEKRFYAAIAWCEELQELLVGDVDMEDFGPVLAEEVGIHPEAWEIHESAMRIAILNWCATNEGR